MKIITKHERKEEEKLYLIIYYLLWFDVSTPLRELYLLKKINLKTWND